ncbi:MAG: RHS repeat-associated core domain-containing protein [Bacilli bacterium]
MIGHFLSKDAYEGAIENPLTLNQYTYVLNNPVNFVDPSGHIAENQWDSFLKGMASAGAETLKDLLSTPER